MPGRVLVGRRLKDIILVILVVRIQILSRQSFGYEIDAQEHIQITLNKPATTLTQPT